TRNGLAPAAAEDFLMAEEKKYTRIGANLSDLEMAWQDRMADAQGLFAGKRDAGGITNANLGLEIRLKMLICKRLDLPQLAKAFEVHDLQAVGLVIHTFDEVEARGTASKAPSYYESADF